MFFPEKLSRADFLNTIKITHDLKPFLSRIEVFASFVQKDVATNNGEKWIKWK